METGVFVLYCPMYVVIVDVSRWSPVGLTWLPYPYIFDICCNMMHVISLLKLNLWIYDTRIGSCWPYGLHCLWARVTTCIWICGLQVLWNTWTRNNGSAWEWGYSRIRTLNRRPRLSALSNPVFEGRKRTTEDVIKPWQWPPSVSTLHTNHLLHIIVKRLWTYSHDKSALYKSNIIIITSSLFG